MPEKGGAATASYSRPRLAHLESVLREMTQCEERKRQQSVESATANTRNKLLNDQLLQAQEELVTAQASKTKLCEEIGVLKQAKAHQAKQLARYKVDLQTARESKAVMTKKVEELETTTWTVKQQYIQSLASRIKTSALVLQQLNASSGASLSARVTETCTEWEQAKSNKRKRIQEQHKQQRISEDSGKPEHAGGLGENDPLTRDDQPSEPVRGEGPATASALNNGAVEVKSSKPLPSASRNDQNHEGHGENEHEIGELRAQVTKLKSEYSVLSDKHNALVQDHRKVLAESMASAQEIKAKEAKIEELTQMLDISRSKQQAATLDASLSSGKEKEAQEGRLKMLEENLAQMNAYADQLEMVIAQCTSCTVKLQNESTQDSAVGRTE